VDKVVDKAVMDKVVPVVAVTVVLTMLVVGDSLVLQ
jgi:hypothetical protein